MPRAHGICAATSANGSSRTCGRTIRIRCPGSVRTCSSPSVKGRGRIHPPSSADLLGLLVSSRRDQARTIESPWTLIRLRDSGLDAGPPATVASSTENLLPWQGQLITPSATESTVQPRWVHTALKQRNSPSVGWVITSFSPSITVPPPTGMSVVFASAPAWAPPPPPPSSPPPAPGCRPVSPPPPPEPDPESPASLLIASHADSTPAMPASPTPARSPRRVL